MTETEIAEIGEQSRKRKKVQNLMCRVNKRTLTDEFRKQETKKAKGVDGVDKTAYGENLDGNLCNLVERMKKFQYRPLPVRRKYIPKANGKLRPLGILAFEDRLVQQSWRKN